MDDKNIDYMGKPIPIELDDDRKTTKLEAAGLATALVIGFPLVFAIFIFVLKWIVDNGYIPAFGILCGLIVLTIIWYSVYKDLSK